MLGRGIGHKISTYPYIRSTYVLVWERCAEFNHCHRSVLRKLITLLEVFRTGGSKKSQQHYYTTILTERLTKVYLNWAIDHSKFKHTNIKIAHFPFTHTFVSKQ